MSAALPDMHNDSEIAFNPPKLRAGMRRGADLQQAHDNGPLTVREQSPSQSLIEILPQSGLHREPNPVTFCLDSLITRQSPAQALPNAAQVGASHSPSGMVPPSKTRYHPVSRFWNRTIQNQ
ncbi:MAG TPA: hypothetical protein DDY91_10840 [Planctomycetaceae bacterium]|nr:hypothetical protein [Planctomycetaceae bacterium]